MEQSGEGAGGCCHVAGRSCVFQLPTRALQVPSWSRRGKAPSGHLPMSLPVVAKSDFLGSLLWQGRGGSRGRVRTTGRGWKSRMLSWPPAMHCVGVRQACSYWISVSFCSLPVIFDSTMMCSWIWGQGPLIQWTLLWTYFVCSLWRFQFTTSPALGLGYMRWKENPKNSPPCPSLDSSSSVFFSTTSTLFLCVDFICSVEGF